jgi:hypothetical protein
LWWRERFVGNRASWMCVSVVSYSSCTRTHLLTYPIHTYTHKKKRRK